MTLQDQVLEDNRTVFLAEDEFAETHTLNGIPCRVVVDSDQLEKWKSVNLTGGLSLPEQVLTDVQVYLFLAAEDFPDAAVGQVVKYDGRPLRVVSVSVNEGMMELVLGGVSERGR